MKILCECGHIISDQTDYIPYKAYFVADQDYFDLSEAIDEQIEKLTTEMGQSASQGSSHQDKREQAMSNARDAISRYLRREIFQCAACGRLFVDDNQSQLQVFIPKDDSVSKVLMSSIEGDKWRRHLRGHWNEHHKGANKGELWWGFGDGGEFERFDDLGNLTERYFEIFVRMQNEGILRDAFLRKGKEMLHRWPLP